MKMCHAVAQESEIQNIFSHEPQCPVAVRGALGEPPVLWPRGDDKPVICVSTTDLCVASISEWQNSVGVLRDDETRAHPCSSVHVSKLRNAAVEAPKQKE